MRTCIINVGVNASHGTLRSPLFEDGSFIFITIPDSLLGGCSHPGISKYQDIGSHPRISIDRVIGRRHLMGTTHYDPEFETYTYGDYPKEYPRSANLMKLERGDRLLFYARLVHWANARFSKRAGFFLIGHFVVQDVYPDINEKPDAEVFQRIKRNAHVVRGECDEAFYDGFWVVTGGRGSKLYKKAVPFDKKLIESCGIKSIKGAPIKWRAYSTELQAIGSYFRSSRILQGTEQERLWEHISIFLR